MKSLLCSMLLLALAASHAKAQEVQVPFDSAGKVTVITNDDEQTYHLFKADPYFKYAHLFRNKDSSYTVELTRDSADVTIQNRIPWTLAEKLSAERRIGMATAPPVVLNQDGRTSLLWSSVVLSLAGYGTMIPIAFNMQDARTIAGTDLLMGGGSYLLVSTLTANAEVTKCEASLATTGGVLGIGHGWLLTAMMEGQNIDARGGAAISTLTSIGEYLGGYYIARDLHMAGGTASLISLGGTFGAFDGFGISYALMPNPSSDLDVRLYTGLSLAGSVAGYLGGYWLTSDHPYSEGDATTLWIATTLGGAIPLVNLLEANVTDHVAVPLISIAGSLAATAVVHNALRNTNFTQSQGLDIGLATLAGALAMTGIAWIAKANDQTTVALGSAGAIGGFCVAYATTRPNSWPGMKMGTLDLQLNPSALLAARYNRMTPLAGLAYRF